MDTDILNIIRERASQTLTDRMLTRQGDRGDQTIQMKPYFMLF
jgi:hypothetical protein